LKPARYGISDISKGEEFMTTKSKYILGAAGLLVSFLIGFVPQLRETWRLQSEVAATRSELSDAQSQARIDELRNLAGQMMLESMQQNYGVAQNLSTQYFDRLTQLATETEKPDLKDSLSRLLGERDAITAGLTQGSSLVIPDLQSLLRRTYDLRTPEVARN
jgi:hypothetical protein